MKECYSATQSGTETCYLPCNMLLSSSKMHRTLVKVCIVEYLLIAWQLNGGTLVESIILFEHNFEKSHGNVNLP